ncbi:hypothetical protein POM88_016211 [Heracleum sosnowskyi]|uniref:Uncharacterized protein n=1 Tax=Heracleum sosnowskyi TaxID=360622 RepID=A0AAD8ING4_9APIA|nr:hypothetical protein POM88_016211 [Heracleum sosnowskyi]
MVSSKFSSFVFLIVFIFCRSSAHMHQVTEKIDHIAAGKSLTVDIGSPAVFGKDILDAVPTPGEASNPTLGGREMMKRRLLTRQMVKGKDTMINLAASKIYGADSKGKKKLTTEFDMKVESVNYQHVKRNDLSSFVALNADYHPPKSHPPKNN